MNETMKNLVGLALDKAVPNTWTTLTHEDLLQFAEVFAQLIVKECGKVIDDHYEPVYDGNLLQQHFGFR